VTGIKEKQVFKRYIAIYFCNISKRKHRQKRLKTTALDLFYNDDDGVVLFTLKYKS